MNLITLGLIFFYFKFNHMKNFTFKGYFIALIASLIAGCGLSADNKAAQETVSKFYDALKDGNAPLAASYCGTDEKMTTQAWEEILSINLNSMGNVTGYEKSSGFSVSKENRTSRVKLSYTVNYVDGKSTDSLELVNKGDGFKLYVYSPVLDQATYQDEMNRAEKNVVAYYNALQSGDYQSAIAMVGYSGLEKHPTNEWLNFYRYAETAGGKISEYTIDKTASKSYLHTPHSEAGMGNTYTFLIKTIRNNNEIFEHVDLFQPKYGEPLLIVAHNIE